MDFGYFNMDCMKGMKSIGDGEINLTLTDIPYDGVNDARTGGGIRVTNKGAADVITFDLEEFLSELWRVTSGTIIIFCGIRQVSKIYDYYKKTDATVRQIIWEKTNPSPMNGDKIYLSGIENAIWVRKPKATFNAFCKNPVFRFPTGSSTLHPTEKNHELLTELIIENSNVGDIVLDPCAGSASTLLMARNTGRRFIGYELNKEYYNAAKRRFDNHVAQMNIFDFMEDKK